MSIHPTAVVESGAEIDPTAEIGALAYVGANVRLAARVLVHAHGHVWGHTELGADSQVFPFASVGGVPQDLKYKGGPTRVVIGERNLIREHVTIQPGTEVAGGLTTVGDDNLLMNGVHVAHDCRVGSHVIMANNVLLAGHVVIEDHAYLAGGAAVQQNVRVGESAMVAGLSGLMNDCAPFTMVNGWPARVMRVNRINLERRGFEPERIEDIERAFRIIFRSKLRAHETFAKVREELPHSKDAERMVAFLEKSERGFARRR